jgi:predicted nucleic-acid-binding protein
MSAVDTNVLVRYYVRDDNEQFEKALALFQQATIQNPVYINHVVLTEWVWVLTRAYKIRKKLIVTELEIMLDSKEIELEDKETLRKAIQEFEQSSADFSDCLISAKNQGSSKDPTFTFDKEASKLKGMKLLT